MKSLKKMMELLKESHEIFVLEALEFTLEVFGLYCWSCLALYQQKNMKNMEKYLKE